MIFSSLTKIAIMAIFVFVLLLISPLPHYAAEKSSPSMSKLIAQAQELIILKNRKDALKLLLNGVKKLPQDEEWQAAVVSIATIFLFEKSQQQYELAMTLRYSNLDEAISRLKEAQESESDNTLISLELARVWLEKGSCDKAEVEVNKWVLLAPFLEEIKLIQAQIYLCQNKTTEFNLIRGKIDIKNSKHKTAWLSADIENFIKWKALASAEESLKQLQSLDKDNPEILYWKWKLDPINNKTIINKYIIICKEWNSLMRRAYSDIIQFCKKSILSTEVKAEVSK